MRKKQWALFGVWEFDDGTSDADELGYFAEGDTLEEAIEHAYEVYDTISDREVGLSVKPFGRDSEDDPWLRIEHVGITGILDPDTGEVHWVEIT